MMDSTLDTGARRLFLSAALGVHAARRLHGRLSPATAAEDLLRLSMLLAGEVDTFERRHRLRFEPPYPGLTAGPVGAGGPRLLLACRASDDDGTPLGVVFTSLIPGRAPLVSAAPVGAPIPADWRPPHRLL